MKTVKELLSDVGYSAAVFQPAVNQLLELVAERAREEMREMAYKVVGDVWNECADDELTSGTCELVGDGTCQECGCLGMETQ